MREFILPEQDLLFLISAARSGSTVVSHLLGQTAAIHVESEPWLMMALEQLGRVAPNHEYGSHHLADAVDRFLGPEPMRVLSVMARAAYGAKLAPGKSVFLDKTPRYFTLTRFLRRVFPRAKFLILTRNPLDVVASYKTTWHLDVWNWMNADELALINCFHGLEQVDAFAEEMAGRENACVIDYAEFVTDPTAARTRIMQSLGIADEIVPEAHDPGRIQVLSLDPAGYGDRKIFQTPTVHRESLDAWRKSLTAQEAGLVAAFFGLTGKARLDDDPLYEARATALRGYINQRLEARRSNVRALYEPGAQTPKAAILIADALREIRRPLDGTG